MQIILGDEAPFPVHEANICTDESSSVSGYQESQEDEPYFSANTLTFIYVTVLHPLSTCNLIPIKKERILQ